VFLSAGVAVVNPEYDPELPYSQKILITKPERICSLDESKMKLDCTRGGLGKKYQTIRDGPDDDGATVVTKSDKCASAVCGRLGEGRSLPVFMCLLLETRMDMHVLPATFATTFWTRTASHSLGDT
jgi:hypothetical protein